MNRSLFLKTLVTGALALVLIIPVAMIRDLVSERQARRNEAVGGIAEGWGKRQLVSGPYLAIPYERHWTEVKRETIGGVAHEKRIERSESSVLRLPADSADWSVIAELSEKARGIYKARLYDARVSVTGSFTLPARGSVESAETSRYRWYPPRLVLGIADPLGIRAAPGVKAGGRDYAFAPGSADASVSAGLHAILADVQPGAAARKLEVSFALELGGSEAFAIAPFGGDTTVDMRANWPHPSFQGRFLPARHDIGADGFTASWKVSRLATASANCAWPCLAQQIAVSFVDPAGLYTRLERASKYGFLFIGLTFGAFMLFELVRRVAIHPIQYTLVGLALALFFLLLTALSEHIDFAAAYMIATLSSVGLVAGYLVHVLRNRALGLAFGAALGSLYAMLYSLLQAEDYALLGGALLLFALLAAVMIATRKLDWYAVTAARGVASA